MGLDMYLTGRKFFWHSYTDRSRERKEDGKKVVSIDIELGYWRKHPNLHGYMVQTFSAKGEDDQREIELSADDLRNVIAAIETNRLPTTSGFFFGESDGSETVNDLRVLRNALAWLEAGDASPVELEPMGDAGAFSITAVKPKPVVKPQQNVTRSVHYRGDW